MIAAESKLTTRGGGDVRTAMMVVVIVFCLPLWAEETDSYLDRPVEIGLRHEGDTAIGNFFDGILFLEYDYDLDLWATDQILMTYPLFSPGIESIDDRLRGGFLLQPPIWEHEISRRLGHQPIRLDQYYWATQYRCRWIDARAYIPIIYDGRRPNRPIIDLSEVKLLKINRRLGIIARGYTDFRDWDFDLGLSGRLGSLEAKIYSDLEWSVGFRTTVNR